MTSGDGLISETPKQCDLLVGEGLAEERIILAHMDRNPDPARHLELLARGVFLVYDTIGRTKYFPDSVRVEVIERSDEHPTINSEDGRPPGWFRDNWGGFSRSGRKELSLWALVVGRIER